MEGFPRSCSTTPGGGGAPVTLVLQDPDTFSFDHRLKEWSLLHDPETGLESTALTVRHDGHCHRAVTSNTTVEWAGEGGCPITTLSPPVLWSS